MSESPQEESLEISPRERGFLKSLDRKYSRTTNPLWRSLIIFTLLIVIAHGIERSPLPGWAALILIYVPAVFLFQRYRKFAIFKARLMRKLTHKAGIVGQEEPGQHPAATASQ